VQEGRRLVVRLGVVGVGRIGRLHAESLSGLKEVDSLLLVDAMVNRSESLAEQLGAEAVDTVDELLKRGVDGVVVATATESHPELIERVILAGLPVFCEKPLAKTLAEGVRLVRRIDDTGAAVQVGFQRRFDPGYLAARKRLQSGSLGWIHTLRSLTLDPSPPPASYVAQSGGIIRDCSVHDIDSLLWMVGQPAVEVYAMGANRGASYFKDYDDVDVVSILIRFADGALGLVSSTRYNAHGYDVRLEILGSESSIAVGLDEHTPLSSVEANIYWPKGPPYMDFLDRFRGAYANEMRAFVSVVSGRTPSPCTAAEALETSYVTEACELSRHENRPVTLEELGL